MTERQLLLLLIARCMAAAGDESSIFGYEVLGERRVYKACAPVDPTAHSLVALHRSIGAASTTSVNMTEPMVEPNTASFVAGVEGKVAVNVGNPTQGRIAFKIKTSDNVLYKVSPVFAFVEPATAVSIEIYRAASAAKDDMLVVQYAPAPNSACALLARAPHTCRHGCTADGVHRWEHVPRTSRHAHRRLMTHASCSTNHSFVILM